jgi:hypothetical protein
MTTFSYPYSSFTNAVSLGIPVNQQRLAKEIINSSITRTLSFIKFSGTITIITFSGTLTIPQRSTLSGSIIPSHPNNNISPPSTILTSPNNNFSENNDYFAGDALINSQIQRIFYSLNGITNNSQWQKCNQTLQDLSNTNLINPLNNNILSLSGNVWTSKTLLSLIPISNSMFFSIGNPNNGRFIGQSISTAQYQQSCQLTSFSLPLTGTIFMYASIGTTNNTPTITLTLNRNGVNTSLSTTFTTGGGAGIKNRLVSATGISINLADRLAINSSIPTNTNNLDYIGVSLFFSP